MNRYDDIIGLPHHVSSRHPHMAMKERAAQFSPFAALTGYGDAVRETAKQHIRETEEKNSNSTLMDDEYEIHLEDMKELWND